MKKIVRLTENDLTHLVKKVIEEQSLLNEQLTLLSIPPVNIKFTSGDNTKQIVLKGIDPQTKRSLILKYNITGNYGIFGFDVELRNIKRLSNGNLYAEAKPSNSNVHSILKVLVSKQNLTPDGWLYINVPSTKINEAINMLRQNEGGTAILKAGHGVTIKLTRVK